MNLSFPIRTNRLRGTIRGSMSIWIAGNGHKALTLARLIQTDAEVVLATDEVWDYACSSRHIDRINQVPKHSPDSNQFQQEMVRLVNERDMVIFTDGRGCLFGDHDLPTLTPLGLQRNLRNKQEMYRMMREQRIPHLNFYTAEREDEIPNGIYIDIENFPPTRHTPRYTNPERVHPGRMIVNSDSSGERISVFAVAYRGQILKQVTFQYTNIHHRVSTQRVRIEPGRTPAITEMLVRNLGYTGFLGIDFLVREDVPYPIGFKPWITDGAEFLPGNCIRITPEYELEAVDQTPITKSRIVSTLEYIYLTSEWSCLWRKYHSVLSLRDPFPGIVMVWQYLTNTISNFSVF